MCHTLTLGLGATRSFFYFTLSVLPQTLVLNVFVLFSSASNQTPTIAHDRHPSTELSTQSVPFVLSFHNPLYRGET